MVNYLLVFTVSYRMHGKTVLWVPGMDHAGIATQSVVERDLLKQYSLNSSQFPINQSKSSASSCQVPSNPRLLLGRENFIQRIWDWKNQLVYLFPFYV